MFSAVAKDSQKFQMIEKPRIKVKKKVTSRALLISVMATRERIGKRDISKSCHRVDSKILERTKRAIV